MNELDLDTIALLDRIENETAFREFAITVISMHDELLAMTKAYYNTLPDDGPAEQDYYAQVLEKFDNLVK